MAGVLSLFQHLEVWEPQASALAQKQGSEGPLLGQQHEELCRPTPQQNTCNWWTLIMIIKRNYNLGKLSSAHAAKAEMLTQENLLKLGKNDKSLRWFTQTTPSSVWQNPTWGGYGQEDGGPSPLSSWSGGMASYQGGRPPAFLIPSSSRAEAAKFLVSVAESLGAPFPYAVPTHWMEAYGRLNIWGSWLSRPQITHRAEVPHREKQIKTRGCRWQEH